MSTRPPLIPAEWQPDSHPLPAERDFNPFGGDLDAQCAWKNFGGLPRTEAYERFLENPLYYQEDFMFMGGVAFAYYYPVIERFLLEAVENDPHDRQAWILAHAIKQQFSGAFPPRLNSLCPRIQALANYVRCHLTLYDDDCDEQQRIDAAWHELESHLSRSSA